MQTPKCPDRDIPSGSVAHESDNMKSPGDAVNSAEALRVGFFRSGMARSELWANYISIGGGPTEKELFSVIIDGDAIAPHHHDMVAQALNDQFIGVGLNHLVPYYYQLQSYLK